MDEFLEADAGLVVISPQTVEHNGELASKMNLRFPLLSDAGNAVAREFGLTHRLPEDLQAIYRKFPLNLSDYNGDESWTLPIPARFVADSSGIVRHADADPDYTRRPEPAATLAEVRKILGT